MATGETLGQGGGRPDTVPQTDSDAQLAEVTATIAERLATVCRDWDPAVFNALIERMARTKLRWAEREAVTDGLRGSARETPRKAPTSAPERGTGDDRDA